MAERCLDSFVGDLMVVAYANQATMLAEVSPTGDTASKSRRFPVSCCNVADLEVQSHIIASVAERSNAGDCKSPGLRPTLVRIQPGARVQKSAQAFAWAIFVRAPGEQYLSTVRLDSKRRRLCFSTSWRETSEAPSKKLSLFYECREIK